jgi:hypothetical protein
MVNKPYAGVENDVWSLQILLVNGPANNGATVDNFTPAMQYQLRNLFCGKEHFTYLRCAI